MNEVCRRANNHPKSCKILLRANQLPERMKEESTSVTLFLELTKQFAEFSLGLSIFVERIETEHTVISMLSFFSISGTINHDWQDLQAAGRKVRRSGTQYERCLAIWIGKARCKMAQRNNHKTDWKFPFYNVGTYFNSHQIFSGRSSVELCLRAYRKTRAPSSFYRQERRLESTGMSTDRSEKRCGKTRWVSVKNSHVLCTFSHKHLLNSRTDIRRQRKDDSEGSKRATLG